MRARSFGLVQNTLRRTAQPFDMISSMGGPCSRRVKWASEARIQ